jgi:hypothetical protein
MLVLIGWVDLVFLIWLLGCEDDGWLLFVEYAAIFSDAFFVFELWFTMYVICPTER